MSRELPVDLYRQIVDDIQDKTDLLSLCLASRALYLEASRALYAKVHLEGHRQTSAALRTFKSSVRLAELVVELILRVGGDPVEFAPLTLQAIPAINLMCNLTRLEIPYLWASNPFETSGTRAPWAPREERQGFAWTRNLNLPRINTLVLETTIHRPVRELFGELPYPLPRLETSRPLSIAHLDGIESVRCERVYGSRTDPLVDLKSLEVLNLDTYPTGATTVMPNLDTLVFLYPDISNDLPVWGTVLWHLDSGNFDQLRRLGPVYAEKLQSIHELSRVTGLESVLIGLPFIAFRDFAASHAQRLAERNPSLRRIGLLTNVGGSSNIKRARIWECRPGELSPSESEWWSSATFRVRPEGLEKAMCGLVYQVPPSKWFDELVADE